MKKMKNENLVATVALIGIVLLFGGFFVIGNGMEMILIAGIVACCVFLVAMLLNIIRRSVKKSITVRYLICCVFSLTLVGGLVFNARAAYSFVTQKVATHLTVSATSDYAESNMSGSVSDGTITINTKGYSKTVDCDSKSFSEKVTVIVENNNTYAVSYDLMLTNATGAEEGKGLRLDSGKTLTIYVESGEGSNSTKTGTIVFSNVKPISTGETHTTTFKNSIGGVISVDGTDLTQETAFENPDDYEYKLVATAISGYKFVGWMSDKGILGSNSAMTYQAVDDVSIWPLFMKNDSALYYIDGVSPSITYSFIDEAVEATKNESGIYEGVVVVSQTGTMYHSSGDTEIEIPFGVTLLLPRMPGVTDIKDEKDLFPNANYALWNKDDRWQFNVSNKTYQNVVLTIPTGTIVNNSGRIVLGGTITSRYAYNSGGILTDNYYNHDTGTANVEETEHDHSDIILNGTLNMVGDNAILSSIGFITGSGTINATETGAKIYQPFVINDYRGGNYVLSAAGKTVLGGQTMDFTLAKQSSEELLSPFIRYTMQNIQVTINMEYGNYMYGYCDMWANSQHNQTTALIIGDGSDAEHTGLLNLKSGANLTAKYQDSNKVQHLDTYLGSSSDGTYNAGGWGYNQIGRTKLEITGGAYMAALSLNVTVKGVSDPIPMNLNNVVFPIPYNFHIILKNGNYEISNSTMILPGAELTVGRDASLIIGDGTSNMKFMVMDGLFDHTMYSDDYSKANYSAYESYPDYSYPKTAELIKVDLPGTGCLNLDGGKLIVNPGVMFGGLVQTDGTNGSQVTFNGNSGCEVQIGLTGLNDSTGAKAFFNGSTVRTLPARLMNGNGEYVTMTSGKVYRGAQDTSNVIDSYTYTLYTAKYTRSGLFNPTYSQVISSQEYTEEAGRSHSSTCIAAAGGKGGTKVSDIVPGSSLGCICSKYDAIPVEGMWYEYMLTIVEDDKSTDYYYLDGKYYTSSEVVNAHVLASEVCQVSSDTGIAEEIVSISNDRKMLNFNEIELTQDVTLTVISNHSAGEEASCTEGQKCTVCGVEIEPAKGHDFQYTEGIKETVYKSNDLITWTYTCSVCDEVGDVLAGNTTVQEIPCEVSPEANLWKQLQHDNFCFYGTSGNGKWQTSIYSTQIYSVTIPVNEGDQIYASSFESKESNGQGKYPGSFVTYIMLDGSIKAYSRTGVTAEWAEKGYITIPKDVKYVNIHMWGESDSANGTEWELRILNRSHNYEVVESQEETLTENGYVKYICSKCQEEYTEIRPCLATAEVSGIYYATLKEALDAAPEGFTIKVFKAPEPNVVFEKHVRVDLTRCMDYEIVANGEKGYSVIELGENTGIWQVAQTGKFNIAATNMKAGDSLALYFYVQVSDLPKETANLKAVLSREGEKDTTIAFNQWTSYGEGAYYRFAYNGIAAKEMTNVVTVRIYDGDELISNPCSESVENYAVRLLKSISAQETVTTVNEKIRTTVVDMLNYGAECQNHFLKENAGKLANVQIGEWQEFATVLSSEDYCDDLEYSSAYFRSPTVTTESSLVYTFYFYNIDPATTKAVVEYTDHYGTNKSMVVPYRTRTETSGEGTTILYGIDIKGLAIADGRQMITCDIHGKDQEGKDVIITTAKGSIEDYVAQAVQYIPDEKDLFLNLLKFVDSSYAYFRELEESK